MTYVAEKDMPVYVAFSRHQLEWLLKAVNAAQATGGYHLTQSEGWQLTETGVRERLRAYLGYPEES